MPLKKALLSWFQKFIYGWLIFCIGGVGSLTYFDGYLPGHEHRQHPYHLSIVEAPSHPHDPLSYPPEPKVLPQSLVVRLAGHFGAELDFLIAQQHLAAGLAQFFQSGLSDGYLLTITRDPFNPNMLFGRVAVYAPAGRSTWLAPPEKPPQSNLA